MVYWAIVLLLLLVAYTLFCLWIALKIVRNQENLQKPPTYKNPSELNLTFEEVSLPVEKNLKLEGWYFPANSGHTLLLLHGIHLSKAYLIPFAKAFQEMGINVLLPDHRAHGKSGGKWISYGKKEVQDIIKMVEWLEKEKPFQKLSIFGISYGSIVGSQAAVKIRQKIQNLVFQSPYTNLDTIIKWTISKKLGRLTGILMPGIRLWVRALAGFWLNEVKVLEACEELHKPILFIAAEKDEVCPLSETIKCYEASSKSSQLWVIKDANHNNIHKVAGEEVYFKRIYSFITHQ